jgi:hypothetical protein
VGIVVAGDERIWEIKVIPPDAATVSSDIWVDRTRWTGRYHRRGSRRIRVWGRKKGIRSDVGGRSGTVESESEVG